MTGATKDSKQKRQRETSRLRQADYRQRKAGEGLLATNLKMTGRAHQCLVELKAKLDLPNLNVAAAAAIEAQAHNKPPLPRYEPGDPAGSRSHPFWLSEQTSDKLNDTTYKHRWHALCAFIVAHHKQVFGGE